MLNDLSLTRSAKAIIPGLYRPLQDDKDGHRRNQGVQASVAYLLLFRLEVCKAPNYSSIWLWGVHITDQEANLSLLIQSKLHQPLVDLNAFILHTLPRSREEKSIGSLIVLS